MESLSTLRETYNILRENTFVLSRSNDVLMTQALLLVATKSTHRIDELLEYWETNKTNTSLFSNLRGGLINTISILGMTRGISPDEILRRTTENKDLLREVGLTTFWTGGSVYTNGTAAYLAVMTENPKAVLHKLKEIVDLWKKDHPWVTGNNDLFYGVLHALQEKSAEEQAQLTEECFQALKRGGHSGWADEVQAAAQAAALWPDIDIASLESRYAVISRQLSDAFSFFAPNLRPVTSLLAASTLELENIVPQLMDDYNALGEFPLSGRSTRLLLAANLLLLTQGSDENERNDRLIAIIVGVMYAQEVAVTAAVVAATMAAG